MDCPTVKVTLVGIPRRLTKPFFGSASAGSILIGTATCDRARATILGSTLIWSWEVCWAWVGRRYGQPWKSGEHRP